MLNYPISVFLDTNIFRSAKYDFSEKGIFNTLKKYINDNKIKLYISHIVEGEVKKHLSDKTSKIYNAFKTVRTDVSKEMSSNLLEKTSVAKLFNKIEKDSLNAEFISIFDRFIDDSKATVLDSSEVDCNKIMSDYFSSILPFEQKDSKKHEFPDAIMAAKLKLLFNQENPIYVISNDSGFRNSFDGEKGFVTFDSLKDVFNLINKEVKIYENIISFILNPDTHNSICDALTNELYDKVIDIDGLDCDRKGMCEGYEYEEVCIDDISEVHFEISPVDDITDDTASITLSCTASISARCSYFDESNSVWDSEEKEYIFSEWGYVDEKHQPRFDCDIILSINQSGENIRFDVKSIYFEVSLDQWTRVSRCEIEPDEPYSDNYEPDETENF